MKIIYMPHRGTLAEALSEQKEFDTVEGMLKYIKGSSLNGNAFDITDINIRYYCYDERIKGDTYLITINKYFNEDYIGRYGHPIAFGYCTFKY